jgi:uncharacterized sulfatase
MPGVPSGKCNLYDHGVGIAMVARVPGGKGGRIINDFVRLPDLAPTFMEVAGVKPPEGLYGKTLLPLLRSEKDGQIDPSRNWVITGRERHVGAARDGNLPYPMRALRTPEFVYIRNFQPDRMPLGSAKNITETETPDFNSLQNVTYTAFADMDASPTKAWLIHHRNDPKYKWLYDFTFGKRPAEELYDIANDPDQINNVALNPKYSETKANLSAQLMKSLTDAKDPRVTTNPVPFEHPPFTDGNETKAGKAGKAANKKDSK